MLSCPLLAQARQAEDLLKSWDHIMQQDTNSWVFEYDTNQQYTRVVYTNGYKYSETSKKTTSLGDIVGGIISRMHYTRVYTTY